MWTLRAELALAPSLEQWPELDGGTLKAEEQENFECLRRAVVLYVQGHTSTSVERLTGVGRHKVARTVRRCLRLAPDGKIMGFRGLRAYLHTKEYVRNKQTSPKRPEQQGGQSGALSALLIAMPNLESLLIRHISQNAKQLKIAEHRMSATVLHRIFVRTLHECGASKCEWPFNTKYLGLRTIQKYMRNFVEQEFSRLVVSKGKKDAVAQSNVSTGYSPFLQFVDPYDAVEIDAYFQDCFLSVPFLTPEGGETDLLLERIWLIAAVDRVSKAILAYKVVYRSEVTADDVLDVIKTAAVGKWSPLNLTDQALRYPPQSGLPSGCIPNAFGAVWSVTFLDGALAHLANAIHQRARCTIGFVINWGPVGHFERRPNVERAFGEVARTFFQRLPSTTGVSPDNGRAATPEINATRFRIRASEIEEYLDVLIAQKNATPTAALSYRSPLEYLRYFLEGPEPLSWPRHLPDAARDLVKLLVCRRTAVVRGNPKTGKRPYIQIDRVRYTSPVLADSAQLIGRKLVVHIDEDDMRQVKVFLDNGAELGFLTAQGKWSNTKHSRRTRQAINSLLYRRTLVLAEFDDPVQAYLRYLSTPTKPLKKGQPQINKRQVTEAARISSEMEKPAVLRIEPASGGTVVTPTVSDVSTRRSLLASSVPFIGKVRNRT